MDGSALRGRTFFITERIKHKQFVRNAENLNQLIFKVFTILNLHKFVK